MKDSNGTFQPVLITSMITSFRIMGLQLNLNSLQVLDPRNRIGCEELGGYERLKSHAFYKGTLISKVLRSNPKANPVPSFLMEFIPHIDNVFCTQQLVFSQKGFKVAKNKSIKG